jgi:Mce-associated membrane protein
MMQTPTPSTKGPDDAVSDQPAPENRASGKPVPHRRVPEQAAPGKATAPGSAPHGTASEEAASEEAAPHENTPSGTAAESDRHRRATLLGTLAAVLVLVIGCAVWFGLESAWLRPADNAALVDQAGTAQVTEQVGAGVKAIFSYDYTNFARTERAAADVLVDGAIGQYRDGFAAARKLAQEQKLMRATTIRSIGVRELLGDEAKVLVFLDQQTLRTEGNQQDSTHAYLDITAKRVDGAWKIASMTAL